MSRIPNTASNKISLFDRYNDAVGGGEKEDDEEEEEEEEDSDDDIQITIDKDKIEAAKTSYQVKKNPRIFGLSTVGARRVDLDLVLPVGSK
jgi:hypothetical protein